MFFVHSSVTGYFGYFRLLAVMPETFRYTATAIQKLPSDRLRTCWGSAGFVRTASTFVTKGSQATGEVV